MSSHLIMNEQDEYASHAKALLKVVASPARYDEANLGVPDGIVQMSFTNFDGLPRLIEVVGWRRIDGGLLATGSEFDIHLQARQYRDLRLPLHSATIRCALTLHAEDVSLLAVGDTLREGGWFFGVHLKGARVLSGPAAAVSPRG